VVALSHPDQKQHAKARDAWLKFLLSHQLTEKLGWKPEDKQYGGWGYCRLTPKKPEPGAIAPPLIESNLSATVFALEALKTSGVKDTQLYQAAEIFIERCQNGDGGFFFIYDDPVRNKAGSYGGRFQSYGSTTADGVRGLLIAESIRIKEEDKTVRLFHARGNPSPSMLGIGWLEKHFRPDSHPGKYIGAHEPNREAVYYYYAASVSKALRAAGVKEAGGSSIGWSDTLSAELAKRQNLDGSWVNRANLVREDEPLVATANALIALANCKAAVTGAGKP
jgi:squalene-hopene/tetraprenyl-beta-curcumene cyclase